MIEGHRFEIALTMGSTVRTNTPHTSLLSCSDLDCRYTQLPFPAFPLRLVRDLRRLEIRKMLSV